MAAPRTVLPRSMDRFGAGDVDNKLREWVTSPVSDPQLLALVHALALMEADGNETSPRYTDVTLAVKAQIEHRRALGSYIPPWAQTAAMACAPGGVASGITSLEEYRRIVQSAPPVMATAEVIARPPPTRAMTGPVDPDAPVGRDKRGLRLAQWPVMIPTSVRRTLGATPVAPSPAGVHTAGAPGPAGQPQTASVSGAAAPTSGAGAGAGAGAPAPPPKFGEAGWTRSSAELEYAGPASRDGHAMRLQRGGSGWWYGPSAGASPDELKLLDRIHNERDAASMAQYAQRLTTQANEAADEATQRRFLIQAKAARLYSKQRALRRAVADAAGVLSQTGAPTAIRAGATAPSNDPGSSFAVLGLGSGGPGAMTTNAALLARSDGIVGSEAGYGGEAGGDGIVWRVRRRPPRQLAALDRELNRREADAEAQQKARRQAFLRAIVTHSRDVRDRHRHHVKAMERLAKACKAHLEGFQKEADKAAQRMEKARLRALHDGKYDEFKKLVADTKNKRLQHLLDQTDKYLGDIGRLVQAQQDAAMEASRALTPIEAERLKRQQNKGKPRRRKADAAAAAASKDLDPPSKPGAMERAKSAEKDYYRMAHAKQEEIVSQPEMLVGGTLKKYQLVGLQWLVSLYNNNLNGILADEMGLGKTIQTIALLAYLMEVKGNNGPFLIVVPLSTISNWAHELEKWAPDIVVVCYKGTPAKRKEIYKRQMASGQFNVVLTTYTFVMRDKSVLRKLRYQYIIIDEGHRMKNAHCKFSRILGQQYHSRNRVLLTGTPLQNNLPELWSLLNFLLPKVFNSVENFDAWFSKPFSNFGGTAEDKELTMEENLVVINRLHQVLRPFLLRRVKSEVLGQLPGKVERVLRCELSAWQKIVYRQIQEHGQMLTDPSSSGGGGTKALSNVLMHLRKICNHPYLFKEDDTFPIDDNLWRSSGKVELLDRMLPKLMAGGHRVLVFSQMTRLMDVMEDYLSYRGMRYLRLDGHTSADDREQRMLQFNAPDSPYFIFLLSTRAGGLGINLATADTVVIFDSDWNPTMDLQAQDRAHRIGQTREVHVFRLATNTPVEDRILARANNKKNMEDVVINAGQFNNDRSNAAERRALLEDLLEAEAEAADDGVMEDEAINEMMMRSEEEFELYQRMDAERMERERKQWVERRARGEVSGKYKGRLMQESEVPSHVKAPEVVFNRKARKEAEMATYGRGNRERKDVKYNDGLTDTQFLKLIEGEGDLEEFQAANKRRSSAAAAAAVARDSTPASAPAPAASHTPSRVAPSPAPPRSVASVASNADDDDDAEEGEVTTAKPKAAPKKRSRGRRYKPGSRNDPRMKAALKRFNRKLLDSWNVVRYVEDENGSNEMALLFIDKPSRLHYPDYYDLIVRPIGLSDIKRKIQSSRYRNREEYIRDFEILFQNAFKYNIEKSPVYKFAQRMQKAFHEAVKTVPFAESLTSGTKRRRVASDAKASAPAPSPAAPASVASSVAGSVAGAATTTGAVTDSSVATASDAGSVAASTSAAGSVSGASVGVSITVSVNAGDN